MIDAPDWFDACPIPLWIEDFTPLMARLNALGVGDVLDLAAWLKRNPAFLAEAASLIRIVRINRATLDLYGAPDPERFLTHLPELFVPASLVIFEAELLALFAGERRFRAEALTRALDGRDVYIDLSLAVAGDPPDYSQVIVSTVDITARIREQSDFNNWLQALVGQADLALLTDGIPSAVATRLRALIADAGRASDEITPVGPDPVELSPSETPAPPTLLLVEDDPLLSQVGVSVLQGSGYRVIACSDGREAAALLPNRVGEIDLVILDLTLPGMSGEELFTRVRQVRSKLPILITSGRSEEEVTADLLMDKRARFVQKPWRLQTLTGVIEELLGRDNSRA